MAFPRRLWLEMPSTASATFTKLLIEVSSRSGNSENTRYQLLSWENLLASNSAVSGVRRLSAGRRLSTSLSMR